MKPRKFTPDKQATYLGYLKMGTPRVHAAHAVGIHYDTAADFTTANSDFSEAVKEAEGYAVTLAVGKIQQASLDTWQAAAWYLERRYHQDFGRKVALIGGNEEDQPISIKVRMPGVSPTEE